MEVSSEYIDKIFNITKIITEMQIETAIYPLPLDRITISKKTKMLAGCEKRELLFCLWECRLIKPLCDCLTQNQNCEDKSKGNENSMSKKCVDTMLTARTDTKDECIWKWGTHTVKYCCAIKKIKEILLFIMWMNLRVFNGNDKGQVQKDRYYTI